MICKYKECGEFVQSLVRTGVALVGALGGFVPTSLYVWLLFTVATWFNFRRPTEVECAAFGFEAFAIWWATMVATANWIYKRLDAPADDFAEIKGHRELLLILRSLVGIALVVVHVVSLIQNPGAAVGNLVGMAVAFTIVSLVVKQVARAAHLARQDNPRSMYYPSKSGRHGTAR